MASTARTEQQMKEKYGKAAATAKDPVERLQAQALSRGATGIKGLARSFKIMDDNADHTLTFAEFKKGLRDFGLYLDDEQDYRRVFDRFDTNKDGSLDFDEFLRAMRPGMSKSRQDIVRLAFSKLDRDHSGFLTADDLKGVYNVKSHPKYKSGEMSEDDILKEFLKKFEVDDSTRDGQVTWDEFVNYYSGVSASIEKDAYFDLMMRQAWKL